ncbi:MAG: RNA recognition motif domain-containing protein, partial [Planctomycetota bacterium]
MSLRIFVGNLSYQVTDEDLHESFAPFGEIAFSRVILDRDSGKSRGFGFVEFLQEEAGKEAIKSLANKELKGRPLRLR